MTGVQTCALPIYPEVEIVFVHSTSNALKPVTDVHQGLLGETDLCFSDSHPLEEADLLFMCGAHGQSRKFSGIVTVAVGQMVSVYGTDPADILAAVGYNPNKDNLKIRIQGESRTAIFQI